MGNIETFALKQMYLYLSLAEIILEGVFLVKLTYFHHYHIIIWKELMVSLQ